MSRVRDDLAEISAEGRVAAWWSWGLVVVSAIAVAATSWDELWRRCGELSGACVSRSAGAALLTSASVAALAVAVVALRRLARRPVDPYGTARATWALGAFAAAGTVMIASRIPAFTCERGRFDDVLELCLHPPSTSEPSSWLLVKQAVVIGGLLSALVVAATPRRVAVTAPVVATMWLIGLGWTLADALA